ncbi:MAG: ADP-polyphosphate phosphotransferase [Hyphomicrobiaceae bacterium]|nr:ADP-polyphosphate phosphotransferase [Hyphomicrobiaceae bacterium]
MARRIDIEDHRVTPGARVKLNRRPTRIAPPYASKDDYRAILEAHVSRMSDLQELLYASNRHAILVIFQAMDAAGKDGCIKHVMSGVNPQGCCVFTFVHPTPQELRHDFLWRTTRDLPERGKIAIFNRSYYEEVLIVRVHPEILHGEALPDDGESARIWEERYRSINGLERHLAENGTRIVKIFLHVSKEEQRKRLLDRILVPAKNWKIKPEDIEERAYWEDYRRAYEACLEATSSKHAPWYVVPADDKPTARLIVSQIILDLMEGLDLKSPRISKARKAELEAMRHRLEKG